MTDGGSTPASRLLPGARWAARIRHFDSPVLRVRYRGGVVIDPRGIPDWTLLARAVVALPDPDPGLTMDEVRVLDVLTANEIMVAAAEPLWAFTADDYAALTPPGWVWAHVFGTRRVALVPAEAFGAFRHVGGVATMPVDRSRRGLVVDEYTPVPMDHAGTVADPVLDEVEQRLRQPLPAAYRSFLAETNGGSPTAPGVHPDLGIVVDQPLFGIGRPDRHQDVVYASQWFSDRLTDSYLAIGYVQGGVLALQTRGPDVGSVWFYDADDYRDDDGYDAATVCARLLTRCADDLDAFWQALSVPPSRLLTLVDRAAAAGTAHVVAGVTDLGASLPRGRRPLAPPG